MWSFVTIASLATSTLTGTAWFLYGMSVRIRKKRILKYDRAPYKSHIADKHVFYTRSGDLTPGVYPIPVTKNIPDHSGCYTNKTLDHKQYKMRQQVRFKVKWYFISPCAVMGIGSSFVVTNIAFVVFLWLTSDTDPVLHSARTCSNATLVAACALLVSFCITQVRPVSAYMSVLLHTQRVNNKKKTSAEIHALVKCTHRATAVFFAIVWAIFVYLCRTRCVFLECRASLLQAGMSAFATCNSSWIYETLNTTDAVVVYVWVISLVFLSIALRLAHLHWQSAPLLQIHANKECKIQAIYDIVPQQIVVVFVWVNVIICWVTSILLSLVMIVWKYGRFTNSWSHLLVSHGLERVTHVELVQLISVSSTFGFLVATFLFLILPSMLVDQKTIKI
jgi:hypothetical protein